MTWNYNSPTIKSDLEKAPLYKPQNTYQMKIIEAIIERANDGFYSAYCITEMFSGGGISPCFAKTGTNI